MPVPKGTKTKLFDSAKILRGDRAEGDSDLVTWLQSERNRSVYEEVIGLGVYGKALTVLSCSGLSDEEEIDEEKELKESWEVRFRK